MNRVFLTILVMSLTTMIGALAGLVFRNLKKGGIRCLTAAAGGVMLHAVMFGLIEPAVESSHRFALPLLLTGLLLGYLLLSAIRLLPRRLLGRGISRERMSTVLFVLAMGVHQIPEGIAVGVSFGTGRAEDVLTVAGGIALQNLPESMLLVPPLLSLGVSPLLNLAVSLLIAFLEATGVLVGYLAVSFSISTLPLSLGFSAGCMLYVLLTDMIPDACSDRHGQKGAYAALCGMGVMLLLSSLF